MVSLHPFDGICPFGTCFLQFGEPQEREKGMPGTENRLKSNGWMVGSNDAENRTLTKPDPRLSRNFQMRQRQPPLLPKIIACLESIDGERLGICRLGDAKSSVNQ